MTSEIVKSYIAKVEFGEAKILADLALIYQDLTKTMDLCKRLVALEKDNEEDSLLIESLWSSALIRYVRCFNSGKRYGLTTDILKDLPGQPVETHQFFKDLRDKNIAHSVSPYEQVTIGIILSPVESEIKKVEGVTTLSMTHVCLDDEGVSTLGRLAAAVRKKVAEMAKEYEQKVLEFAKTMSIDELYASAEPKIVAPGPEMVGTAR